MALGDRIKHMNNDEIGWHHIVFAIVSILISSWITLFVNWKSLTYSLFWTFILYWLLLLFFVKMGSLILSTLIYDQAKVFIKSPLQNKFDVRNGLGFGDFSLNATILVPALYL